MRQVARQASSENQVLFLPGVFNETLGLLFDAHQYFEARGSEEQDSFEPPLRTVYANEMSRVTTRLTSVMAWLMVRRALYTGELAEAQITEDFRLDAADICLDHQPNALAHMPYYLIYLSERSLALYERIHRLDGMAYGTRH
jgi:hypothetical protein